MKSVICFSKLEITYRREGKVIFLSEKNKQLPVIHIVHIVPVQ